MSGTMQPAPGTRVVDPDRLHDVCAALHDGAVVALPTDTVYGLAARLDRPAAIAGLFAAKGRPPGLALPVLVGTEAQARAVASGWPRQCAALTARFWPGPLTVVVPTGPEVGAAVGGDGRSVGLRLPDHRLVRALCRDQGPLAVTSANRHGEAPATSARAVVAAFAGSRPGGPAGVPVLVVDGGECDGEPSTVVDCSDSPPTLVRRGAVPWAWVEAALR